MPSRQQRKREVRRRHLASSGPPARQAAPELDEDKVRHSDFVYYLREYVRHVPNPKIVIDARVSRKDQRKHLPAIVADIVAAAEALGCRILKKRFEYDETGKLPLTPEDDRPMRKAAVRYAKKHGALLVVWSPGRLLRTRRFDAVSCPDAEPTEAEYRQVDKLLLHGLPVASIVDPDLSPSEIRSLERKRGIAAKLAAGGTVGRRERKKNARARLLPEAIRLKKQGKSYREIGAALGRPHSTIQGWVEGCTDLKANSSPTEKRSAR